VYIIVALALLEVAANSEQEAREETEAWIEEGNLKGFTFHPIARRWKHRTEWRKLDPRVDIHEGSKNRTARGFGMTRYIYTVEIGLTLEVAANDGADAARTAAEIIKEGDLRMFDITVTGRQLRS